MNLRPFLAVSLSVLFALPLIDCSSPEHEEPEECEAIASVCHPAGEVNAEAEECHEKAHAGDLEVCLEIQDECLTLCNEIIGNGGAGGAGGAAH